jgi:hypothetical protein
LKDSFVTNLFLFKVGQKLRLREYVRTTDPDPKRWAPAFTSQAKNVEAVSCTGKNIADTVESLLGAFFMSTNLYRTLKFISDIQLVPLKQARLLGELFPDEDLTFKIAHYDLDQFGFEINDCVSQIYTKYYAYRHTLPETDKV